MSWEVLAGQEPLDGVIVYAVPDEGGIVRSSAVLAASTTHTLRGRRVNTCYDGFDVSFWRGVHGTPSNSRAIVTPQDGESREGVILRLFELLQYYY